MSYIAAEFVWEILGGKRWTCPLRCKIYQTLLKRAEKLMDVPEVAALLASYREAYQLSLDGNVPGELRNAFKTQAISHGCELGNLIQSLTVVPPMSGK